MKSHIITAAVAAATAAGAMLLASPDADADVAVIEMPYCQFEDGSDVDGYCLWVDPDTGMGYINPTPEERARNADAALARTSRYCKRKWYC